MELRIKPGYGSYGLILRLLSLKASQTMASQLFGDHHPANWEWVEWRLKPKERTSVKEKLDAVKDG